MHSSALPSLDIAAQLAIANSTSRIMKTSAIMVFSISLRECPGSITRAARSPISGSRILKWDNLRVMLREPLDP